MFDYTHARNRAIEIAASYFADWKLAAVEHRANDERMYHAKYDAARQMAALLDIDEETIQTTAWRKYGGEIAKAHEENNATF